jgi:hypothetical protein
MDEIDYTERDALFRDTIRVINDPLSTGTDILSALRRHGIAIWQAGQHGDTWDWFCQLSHKAEWGDRGWTAKHCATMDEAIRVAAQEYAKDIVF